MPPLHVAHDHLSWHQDVFHDDHNTSPSTKKHWHEIYVNARDDWNTDSSGDYTDRPDHAAVSKILRDMHHKAVPPADHEKYNKQIGIKPAFDTKA